MARRYKDLPNGKKLLVKHAAPGRTIESTFSQNRYTILSYQDRSDRVRAEAVAGKHTVYLYPDNECFYVNGPDA